MCQHSLRDTVGSDRDGALGDQVSILCVVECKNRLTSRHRLLGFALHIPAGHSMGDEQDVRRGSHELVSSDGRLRRCAENIRFEY